MTKIYNGSLILGQARGKQTLTWKIKIVKEDSNQHTRNFQVEIPVGAAVGRL
jgi:hypothetical protein